MNLLQETKFLMKKYNITANKNYGQNFLTDETIIDSIVQASAISNDDLVIEIGPGLGTLTAALLEKAGKVICIELDPKMLTILQNRFHFYENFELLHADILKVNLQALIQENITTFKHVKVVANLPYYITTPIIMKLLEERLPFSSITVMVQKEVAERLTEKPGGKNCGSITYRIHYFTEPSLVVDVPNSSFLPTPKVDSSVIHLQLLENPRVCPLNEALFLQVIKTAFLQKRKTLLNTLLIGKLGNREFLEEMFEKLDIDLKVRGEKLSLEQFREIADYMYEKSLE